MTTTKSTPAQTDTQTINPGTLDRLMKMNRAQVAKLPRLVVMTSARQLRGAAEDAAMIDLQWSRSIRDQAVMFESYI